MRLRGIVTAVADARMPEWGVRLFDDERRPIGTFLEDEEWPSWARCAVLHHDVLRRLSGRGDEPNRFGVFDNRVGC